MEEKKSEETVTIQKAEKLYTIHAEKMMELNKSGYAGVTPDGEIVDRRLVPDAIPMQKNVMFNIRSSRPVLEKIDFKGLTEEQIDELVVRVNKVVYRFYVKVRPDASFYFHKANMGKE